MTHFNAKMAFDFRQCVFAFRLYVRGAGLGDGEHYLQLLGLLQYLHLGGEIREPEKTFRANLFVVLGITVL